MAINVSQQGRFLLRMPPELRAELKRCAEKNERSLNSEIIFRLNASISRKDPNSDNTKTSIKRAPEKSLTQYRNALELMSKTGSLRSIENHLSKIIIQSNDDLLQERLEKIQREVTETKPNTFRVPLRDRHSMKFLVSNLENYCKEVLSKSKREPSS